MIQDTSFDSFLAVRTKIGARQADVMVHLRAYPDLTNAELFQFVTVTPRVSVCSILLPARLDDGTDHGQWVRVPLCQRSGHVLRRVVRVGMLHPGDS